MQGSLHELYTRVVPATAIIPLRDRLCVPRKGLPRDSSRLRRRLYILLYVHTYIYVIRRYDEEADWRGPRRDSWKVPCMHIYIRDRPFKVSLVWFSWPLLWSSQRVRALTYLHKSEARFKSNTKTEIEPCKIVYHTHAYLYFSLALYYYYYVYVLHMVSFSFFFVFFLLFISESKRRTHVATEHTVSKAYGKAQTRIYKLDVGQEWRRTHKGVRVKEKEKEIKRRSIYSRYFLFWKPWSIPKERSRLRNFGSTCSTFFIFAWSYYGIRRSFRESIPRGGIKKIEWPWEK